MSANSPPDRIPLGREDEEKNHPDHERLREPDGAGERDYVD